MMKNKRFLLLLSLAALGVGVGAVVGFLWKPVPKYTFLKREIPLGGLIVFPQGFGHLGDPENAVKDFRRIYAAMDAFRRIHNRLPTIKEVTDFSKPVAPGHQLTRDDFMTPDRIYSDTYLPTAQNLDYAFAYMTSRPDGAERPAFPAAGEKDVWFVCDDYIRSNQIVQRDHTRDSYCPTGDYIILWSDGTVEKVPYLKAVMHHNVNDPNLRGQVVGFAGQAGLPKKNVTTLASDYTKFYLKIRPKP